MLDETTQLLNEILNSKPDAKLDLKPYSNDEELKRIRKAKKQRKLNIEATPEAL